MVLYMVIELYVLIWGYDNSDKRFILRSRRYFLGRPDLQDMERLGGGVSSYDVLIFNPDNYSEKEFTGYRTLVVSRRHALIYKRFVGERSELVIKDHGPEGKGSKNGTFVNDKMLPKGGEAMLREGDRIRLSSSGPLFVVGIQRENKTEIPLSADVPIEIPAQIAEKLIAKGAVVDHFRVGNRSFVVVSDVGAVELSKDLVINVERETLSKRVISAIYTIIRELFSIKDSIRDGRDEDAKIALQALERILESESCKRIFQDIGAQNIINGLYNDIVKLANRGMPLEDIVGKIDVYIKALDNLVRYVKQS